VLEQQMMEVVKWLSPEDQYQPNVNVHKTLTQKTTQGTGAWFFASSRFWQWVKDNKALLYCTGKGMPVRF